MVLTYLKLVNVLFTKSREAVGVNPCLVEGSKVLRINDSILVALAPNELDVRRPYPLILF